MGVTKQNKDLKGKYPPVRRGIARFCDQVRSVISIAKHLLLEEFQKRSIKLRFGEYGGRNFNAIRKCSKYSATTLDR